MIRRFAARYVVKEAIPAPRAQTRFRVWDEWKEQTAFLKIHDDAGQQCRDLIQEYLPQHPHLNLPVDWGEDSDGQPFSVAPWLDGTLLSHRLSSSPLLPDAKVLSIATEIGGALDALAAQGLVHCDIKSENIMLDGDGSAHLIDFEALRHQSHAPRGGIHGSPHAISPECVRGEALCPAADRYAFGVLLFELLTGVLPFRGDDEAMLRGHLDKPSPNPCQFRPSLPPVVMDLLEQCLEKDPENRPETCAEICQILHDGLLGHRRSETLADGALVIHGDRGDRIRWKRHLLERGWRVRVASTDFSARRMMLERPPERILLDASIAESTGDDLLRFIRANAPTCAIPLQVIGPLPQDTPAISEFKLEVSADGVPAVPDISSQDLPALPFEDTPSIPIPVVNDSNG